MRPTPLMLATAAAAVLSTGSARAGPAAGAWSGTWRLDPARSSAAVKNGAPLIYRFRTSPDGAIRWEIPELGEVVTGFTDGKPMAIRRTPPSAGLTLAVSAPTPRELTYVVAKDGQEVGGGRMMLVDDASAWVDLTWGPQGPGYGAELVYVRK